MVAEKSMSTMKVLIADDNRDSADALAALIQLEFGCPVDTAYDGTQALALALLTPYDVLILDLEMPGLSGLEVASQVSARMGRGSSTLFLAVTGRSDLVDQLTLIDARFHRAFAKPVDHTTLSSALSTHWAGTKRARAPSEFRVLETLTKAVREVLGSMKGKGQQLSFDAEGPELTVHGDEVALHSAFYRLICGAVDLMGDGMVMVAAQSSAMDDGGQLLTVNIAGGDRTEDPSRSSDILHRLGLATAAIELADAVDNGFVYARGVCPNSGGDISYAGHPSEGVLLRLEVGLRPVAREAQRTAVGARAWIADSRSIEAAVLERRLQRLGWRVWRFSSPLDLSKAIHAAHVGDLPELVFVRDDPMTLRSNLATLRRRLPDRSRAVLLVGVGSAALLDQDGAPGWDVRVEPLSPGHLSEASWLAQDIDAASTGPATTSHSLLGRRKVLVVDDIEVNRIVACGLLQVLGYEVAAVADGLDAIEHCKDLPPDVVLMDVNMPVLGGIDATRRIVELQKAGRVAPFAIVMATADDSPETAARCFEAGVTGYLAKPLRLELMRDELRRVGVPAAVA